MGAPTCSWGFCVVYFRVSSQQHVFVVKLLSPALVESLKADGAAFLDQFEAERWLFERAAEFYESDDVPFDVESLRWAPDRLEVAHEADGYWHGVGYVQRYELKTGEYVSL